MWERSTQFLFEKLADDSEWSKCYETAEVKILTFFFLRLTEVREKAEFFEICHIKTQNVQIGTYYGQ